MKMKVTMIMILACTLLLCACNVVPDINMSVGTDIQSTTEPDIMGTPTEVEDIAEPKPADPAPTENTILAPTSEFTNYENYHYEHNNVSITPCHVYWNDGKLIADCFISNGFDVPVYNLNVEKLIFSNKQGVIADAYFGTLENCVVPANSHIVWTFAFSGEAVEMLNGDLNYLHTEFDVSYSY